MDIGAEVRRRRQELGLSGVRLADRAGLAPSAVSQIETGRRVPSSASVVKLAYALNVPVGDLFPQAQSPLPLDTEGRGPRPEELYREFLEHFRRGLPAARDAATRDEPGGGDLLKRVLGAARADAEKDSRAAARLGASESVPRSGTEYEEDRVRAELRNLWVTDDVFENLIWPLATMAVGAERYWGSAMASVGRDALEGLGRRAGDDDRRQSEGASPPTGPIERKSTPR
jgi:transcriptional regulator with XRE-family HTH domain